MDSRLPIAAATSQSTNFRLTQGQSTLKFPLMGMVGGGRLGRGGEGGRGGGFGGERLGWGGADLGEGGML